MAENIQIQRMRARPESRHCCLDKIGVCSSYKRKKANQRIAYFQFPKNKDYDRRRDFLECLKWPPRVNLPKKAYICSFHFDQDNIKWHPNRAHLDQFALPIEPTVQVIMMVLYILFVCALHKVIHMPIFHIFYN